MYVSPAIVNEILPPDRCGFISNINISGCYVPSESRIIYRRICVMIVPTICRKFHVDGKHAFVYLTTRARFCIFFLPLKIYKQIVRKFFNSEDSCNSFSRTKQIDIINFASAICMSKIRTETSAINLGRYVRTRMRKSFYVSTGFVRELNK